MELGERTGIGDRWRKPHRPLARPPSLPPSRADVILQHLFTQGLNAKYVGIERPGRGYEKFPFLPELGLLPPPRRRKGRARFGLSHTAALQK